jgi:hypothetical protein
LAWVNSEDLYGNIRLCLTDGQRLFLKGVYVVLFHVAAKHSVNDCGMYNADVREALQEFAQSIPERCKELGVKLHFAVAGHPDHVFYMLIESDDYSAVCVMLSAVPMKQEFDIKPVRFLAFEQL